ncbi:MAG TPA: DegQ family serine endoprotease [Geminicoccaceae bacterium]|nr:DegQ family serine endoprotease [Geminicoccaceae bacterium]
MTFQPVTSPGRPRRRLATAALSSVAAVALLMGAATMPLAESHTQLPANAAATRGFEEGYADLVAAVQPAVVNVKVERSAAGPRGPRQGRTPFDDPELRRFFERFFGQMPEGMPMPEPSPERRRMMGEGSGFIIDAQGHIVTNAHVAGSADRVEVALQDGTTYQAEVKGVDEKTDLALLKIDAGRPLPFVEFGDSDAIRVGDKVIAIGNPFGLGGTVTAGIVSATAREIGSGPYDDFLQIDAAINRGNSGGPTFNLDGKVVGVNSAIFSPSGGNIGIGFAISSNLAKKVVADLMDDGQVRRGWLGVSIQSLDRDLATGLGLDEPEGALVARVEADTPAARAGVRSGDVIVEFNGTPIRQLRDLTRAVADFTPGETAHVVVLRDGERQTLSAQIAQLPAPEPQVASAADETTQQGRLGLALAPITPEARERLNLDDATQGVLVQEVAPDSPAAEKGIRSGDVILEVAGSEVKSPQQVIDAVRKAEEEGAKSVVVLLQREGQARFEAIPLAVS